MAPAGGGVAVEFGNLDLAGVEEAVRWADAEEWEPGLTDAEPFLAADPDGFFRADVEGDLAATMSAVRVSDSVTFVGLYIVRPDLRGRGIGKALWDRTLGALPGFVFAADAVPAQVPNYERDGFTVAYSNARFAGPSPGSEADPTGGEILDATDISFAQLVEFDGRHCFGPRPEFLHHWIQGEGRASVVLADETGSVTGFAASRMSGLGMRIGPVFSSNPDDARALILSLSRSHEGRIAVDAPLPNAPAVEVLTGLGLIPEFETARIYRGGTPDLPLDQIFGITSLELG